MESLQAAMAEKQFDRIAVLCSDIELQAACSDPPTTLPPSFFASYLLGLLFAEDINEARFLWKRLSPTVKSDAVVAASWNVGKALWQHDFASVHSTLASTDWGSQTAPLALALRGKFSSRMLRLLSSSYTTVSLLSAAALLGLDSQAALALLSSHGWSHNPSSSMLQRGKEKGSEAEVGVGAAAAAAGGGGEGGGGGGAGGGAGGVGGGGGAGMEERTRVPLQRLSEYVFHLEH